MGSLNSPWEENPHVLGHNSTSKTPLEYFGLVTDYVGFLLCAVAILADLLLLFVILKYKRLKTRTNLYLLNFALFHICYILSTPLFYVVLDLFYGGFLEKHWYCVWIRIENFAIALSVTFIAGFGVDAFLEKIRPNWFLKYEARYKYLFSFFYFFQFLMYIISASICLKKGFSNDFNFYFLTTYFFVMLIILLYVSYKEHQMVNCLKLSTPNKVFALKISVTVTLCWLPLFVFYNLLIIFKDSGKVEHILWYTAFIPEYMAYCTSIMTVCRLWKLSQHFKVAFRKFFRRHVSSSDFNELNVEEDEEEINKPL